MLGSLSEALAGLATIAAFRAQPRVEARNRQLLDQNGSYVAMNNALNRWLGVRLEALGGVAAAAVAALALQQRGGGGTLGLAVSYALQVCGEQAVGVGALGRQKLGAFVVEASSPG